MLTLTRFIPQINALEAKLHSEPELSFREYGTTRLIDETLAALPGMVRVELGLETGTVWRLRGKGSGPAVGLRADIDAIRQTETLCRSDRSCRPGIMHACGHDVHTAALLGAAMLLSEMRDQLSGDVVFLFQPAEEVLRGAKHLVSKGLFEKVPFDMLFGLHNQPALPLGTVGIAEGPLMAGKDDFILDIHGKGGHGGLPDTCIDPIVAAAGVVNALQTVVSRNVSPLDAAVLSVCSIHGGTEENLVVEDVRLTGSLRTMRKEVRERALTRLHEIAETAAAAYGCSAKIQTERLTPSVCNSPRMTAIARRAAEAAFGKENIRTAAPCMGCEDFAVYGEHVPAFFYFLGSGRADGQSAPWHKSDFRAEPGTAAAGARLLAASALAAQGML